MAINKGKLYCRLASSGRPDIYGVIYGRCCKHFIEWEAQGDYLSAKTQSLNISFFRCFLQSTFKII
mgnify:CR=1 FL=1